MAEENTKPDINAVNNAIVKLGILVNSVNYSPQNAMNSDEFKTLSSFLSYMYSPQGKEEIYNNYSLIRLISQSGEIIKRILEDATKEERLKTNIPKIKEMDRLSKDILDNFQNQEKIYKEILEKEEQLKVIKDKISVAVQKWENLKKELLDRGIVVEEAITAMPSQDVSNLKMFLERRKEITGVTRNTSKTNFEELKSKAIESAKTGTKHLLDIDNGKLLTFNSYIEGLLYYLNQPDTPENRKLLMQKIGNNVVDYFKTLLGRELITDTPENRKLITSCFEIPECKEPLIRITKKVETERQNIFKNGKIQYLKDNEMVGLTKSIITEDKILNYIKNYFKGNKETSNIL